MAWATDWSRKIRRLDLRLRITATIAAVCVAIAAVIGVTFHQAAREMEVALVDQLVVEELNFLIQHHRANPNHRPAFVGNVEYYIANNEADRRALPAFVRDLKPGRYAVDIDAGRGGRDIAVRDLEGTRYVVVYNVGAYAAREREFREWAIYFLLGIAVLAIGLGYILSACLAHQLASLSVQVARLAPGQDYSPLLNDEMDSDVAVLAAALDTYQLKIITLLRREQDFTANVSHELRTPLTMIRTSCDLLVTEPGLSDKSRERIGYISQAVAHMREQTEGLLLLAREQGPTDIEPISLRECVHAVVLPLRAEIARKGLALHIDIEPTATLTASRSAFCLVLANLLRNAVRYTERGHIRVALDKSHLIVSDSGIGISPDLVPRIFERNFRAANAHGSFGIGLDIVRRICEQVGWRVEVTSQPEHGSAFVLSTEGESRPGWMAAIHR